MGLTMGCSEVPQSPLMDLMRQWSDSLQDIADKCRAYKGNCKVILLTQIKHRKLKRKRGLPGRRAVYLPRRGYRMKNE
jgi:hypothetical protein